VNLAALMRYLREREFTGRVHVELDEYDADIFLNGKDAPPRVRETNHATGQTDESDAALQRLLVRAREAGGLVSVYEGTAEANLMSAEKPNADAASAMFISPQTGVANSSADEVEWQELLRVSGDLIAAVERATANTGGNFNDSFRQARLELADDYSFLDPSNRRFEYDSGAASVQLHGSKPEARVYVASICECLRRVVEKLTSQARDRGATRERVALELAVLARRRQTALTRFHFNLQLDRIAGTRVL
jgi:hypothetical protein